MKGNRYSSVKVFQEGKLEWNHLLLTGSEKNQIWGKFVDIFMFIVDNSISQSIMEYFLRGAI